MASNNNSSSPNAFNPSSFAHDMQLRTRKKQGFDQIEAELPDPNSPALQLANATALFGFSFGSIFNKIGDVNPFGRAVAQGDEVWLFDNTAFRESHLGSWRAEFVAAVFERNAKCKVADIVSGVAKAVGLAEDAKEKHTIEERIMPFLWNVRIAKNVRVKVGGATIKLSPTSANGITTEVVKLESAEKGTTVSGKAKGTEGVSGILEMKTCHAGSHGWGIVSDVDDTIKITATSDPIGILRETFVNTPRPVPGMPQLYSTIKSSLPEDTPWFYLSASPLNLYPMLREFRDAHYPQGTILLRESSWKTISGLLANLTINTEEYKVDNLKKINGWFPQRHMICVGDSTQSDPEAYGEMYRKDPDWIKLILIRKPTDIAAIGLEEKNEPERFEKAFQDIPKEVWHVFEEPSECVEIVKAAVERIGTR